MHSSFRNVVHVSPTASEESLLTHCVAKLWKLQLETVDSDNNRKSAVARNESRLGVRGVDQDTSLSTLLRCSMSMPVSAMTSVNSTRIP
jgi:hypothetical protein